MIIRVYKWWIINFCYLYHGKINDKTYKTMLILEIYQIILKHYYSADRFNQSCIWFSRWSRGLIRVPLSLSLSCSQSAFLNSASMPLITEVLLQYPETWYFLYIHSWSVWRIWLFSWWGNLLMALEGFSIRFQGRHPSELLYNKKINW